MGGGGGWWWEEDGWFKGWVRWLDRGWWFEEVLVVGGCGVVGMGLRRLSFHVGRVRQRSRSR